uniref:SJCHGC03302 protein n=1 Tax=Schistosoma japonicum TaxID=6182 RepID=Q5DAF4_SCHJA|nr:SJCHGC03302 protein [Schistosoma japonicum]
MEIACNNNNHNNSSTTNTSNTIFINSNINTPANVTNTILSSDNTVANDNRESENNENVNRSRKQRLKTTRSHLLKSKTICKALHRFLGHNLRLKQSTYDQKCLSGSNNQLTSVDHISINRHDSVTDFLETSASIPAFLRARNIIVVWF